MELEDEEDEEEPVLTGMKDAYDSLNQPQTPDQPFGAQQENVTTESNTDSVPFNAEIKELEQVAILFDKIREMHKEINPQRDSQMGGYFDQNIN